MPLNVPVKVVPPDEYAPTLNDNPQLAEDPVAVSVQLIVPEFEYPDGIFIVAVYVCIPAVYVVGL